MSRPPLTLPATAVLLAALALATGCPSSESNSNASPQGSATPPPPVAPTTPPPAPPPDPASAEAPRFDEARAAALFTNNCATCHGRTGRGDGPLSSHFNPPPRNIAAEPWRLIDADSPDTERAALVAIIREGIPVSGMTAFAGRLTPEEIDLLARYAQLLHASAP